MKRYHAVSLFILVLVLGVLPVSAAILEVTVKGTVSAVDPVKNTITIANPQQYGCNYPASGSPECSYTPLDTPALSGTVPASSAFSVFASGDPVVATSLGGAGGTWISLAKLYGPGADEAYVTDIVGDPGSIPAPLAGGYSLDIHMEPDCTSCSGTTCTADSASVKVLSDGTMVSQEILNPSSALLYNGRNDGSNVEVTFVKGEASSFTCNRLNGMTGPQPVSIFIVNIVPPIGFGHKDTPVPTTIPTTAPTPLPTTHAGSVPFAAAGALCAAALVLACRKS